MSFDSLDSSESIDDTTETISFNVCVNYGNSYDMIDFDLIDSNVSIDSIEPSDLITSDLRFALMLCSNLIL